MSAPPPPPPHGEAPKTTAGSPPPGAGLGPGNYDIFVIPQRDKGGGFIYLPSLAPNGPSFAAGFACALVLVVLFQSMAPAFRAWWGTYQGMGNMGMTLLVIAVGVGAWAWGKSQNQSSSSSNNGSNANYRSGPSGYGAGANFGGGYANTGPPPPPPPHGNNQYNGPPPNSPPPNHGAGNGGPRSQWQERPQPPPPQEPETEPEPEPEPRKPDPPPKPKPDPSKGAWEKAREETKKREQERKVKEEEERKKAEMARKLKEFREREARERARRDREERERREKLEQEIREKEDLKQKLEKERQEREKLQREKEKAEQEAKEAREREAKEAKEREARAAKEKETKEREEARKKEAAEAAARKARVEAQLEAFRKAKKEREEAEKAKKEREEAERAKKLAEEEAAARKAKEEADRKAKQAAEEAEKNSRKGSSYAFSSVDEYVAQRPTPCPPHDGGFDAAKSTPLCFIVRSPETSPFRKLGTAKVGAVCGLIFEHSQTTTATKAVSADSRRRPALVSTLRQTETQTGVFDRLGIVVGAVGHDDEDNAAAQHARPDPDKIVIRAVYLFMNQFAKTPASQLVSGFGTVTDGLILRITTEGLFIDDDVRGVPQREWDVKAWTLKLVEKMANQRARTADRGATKALTGDEADAYLTEMLRACKSCCRLGLCDTKFKDTNVASSTGQTGEWRTKSLHVLRATVRDQEGKRYMFVLDEEEAWKVAVGVQRLRKGTQVRSLGVSGMSASDARGTLETLGWS
ncbi:trans-sialidase [Colletotrichum higginsianum]|nr:trans-sialidase [Colletotrichum higginsianum]